MTLTFEALEPEYRRLWADVHLRADRKASAMATAKRINEKRERYLVVARDTGVPWPVIGIIHAMECGLDFSRHLHNGDRLTARTHQVPRGRPASGEPPFTWEESASDALRCDHLDECHEWTIPRLLWQLEGYNGWGYRRHHPDVLSPYLWSGTQHYQAGKYVEDGKWSSTAVSGQSGAAAILACLIEICPEADAALGAGAEKVEQGALAFAKAKVDDDEPEPETEAAATTITDLASQGSRIAQLIQRAKAWWTGLGVTGIGLMSTGEATGGIKAFIADYWPILLGVGLVAGFFLFQLAGRYLVTAARDGRYVPRAG